MKFGISETGVQVIGPKSKVYTAEPGHPNYGKICSALIDGKATLDQIVPMFDVKRALSTDGFVIDDEGVAHYNGKALSAYITSRLSSSMIDGFGTGPIARFIEKTLANPNPEVHEDLLRWVEESMLPITEDGNIIAFKRVREDLKDIHSGKVQYSIGKITEIPRESCTFNRAEPCGPGLHFAGRGYHFGSESLPLIMLEIDPADVTSFPKNEPKGRCCRLRTVKIVSEGERDGTYDTEKVIAKKDVKRMSKDSKKKRTNVVERKHGRAVAVVRDGVRIELKDLRDAITAGTSQAKLAIQYGVPRSTLQIWLKLK